MNFENPYYLLFLLAIPVYIALKYFKFLKVSAFPHPWLALIKNKGGNVFAKSVSLVQDMLILSVLAALAIALARPRGGTSVIDEKNIGVDIVLVTDVSGSMLFVDEPPSGLRRMGNQFFDTGGVLKKKTRLAGAKRVMINYIDKQDYNRIGLVLFGTYALTKSPLSSDKELLKTLVSEIQPFVEGSTAIGTGLLTGLNRLKNSKAKSKVVILLTDGVNNAGIVDPITAANAAREIGVKVYTIGIGNKDAYLVTANLEATVYQLGQGMDFNAEVLQQIAQITGGKYYHAGTESALQDVYDEIDKLEKSEFSVKRRVLYEEKFFGWLTLASILFMIWIFFHALVIRIP